MNPLITVLRFTSIFGKTHQPVFQDVFKQRYTFPFQFWGPSLTVILCMHWLMDQKQKTCQISNNSCMILGIFAICINLHHDPSMNACRYANTPTLNLTSLGCTLRQIPRHDSEMLAQSLPNSWPSHTLQGWRIATAPHSATGICFSLAKRRQTQIGIAWHCMVYINIKVGVV